MRDKCMNCGASLHYTEKDYGKEIKCKYCRTEYHLDNLGKVEEFKVKLKIQDRIVNFYISELTIEPIYSEITRLGDNTIKTTQERAQLKLELISY